MSTASRDEIIRFCDACLDAGSFADYGPNGLQVPGAAEVRKVATGVSASLELIERALAIDAQLLIAHHGLFWDFHPRALSEAMAARLRTALAAGLSIAGYHLPLDAHPEIGNNALLRERLGFEAVPGEFGRAKGQAIGALGRSSQGVSFADLRSRIEAACGQEPLVQGAGPDPVHTIGIVTGAGASMIGEAAALELDALLTGEPAEHAMADATEAGLHFIAAGHWATETFGVRALGERIAARFGIEHEFIGLRNPV